MTAYIRSAEKFLAGRWDWTILEGCLGQGKITPTDLDALIERHQHYLLIECKPPNGPVPLAQQILFDALTRDPRWTILVLRGDSGLVLAPDRSIVRVRPPSIHSIQVWPSPAVASSVEGLRRTVAAWYQRVDSWLPLRAHP